MKAVAKDWGHFRAIADAAAAEEDALLDEFACMTPSERLEAGFALLDDSPWTPQQLAVTDGEDAVAVNAIVGGNAVHERVEEPNVAPVGIPIPASATKVCRWLLRGAVPQSGTGS